MDFTLDEAMVWVVIGFLGQALFSARFIIQWLHSEKARKSVVPLSFWYFSIAGGAVLTAYAIYRKDPVFIFGQSLGLLIYVRNLVLIHRHRESPQAPQ
ncbi:MAG: lipid-A-disaccharide synthase N-terminal domain-containing protein [Azovibrio sp.]|uniref:lipid-A-disaccharide synthase N-terminal domain-containing protein n=1 Tax=Azovibrio sp. TaxID=1872673 RepID=UPI003C73B6D7